MNFNLFMGMFSCQTQCVNKGSVDFVVYLMRFGVFLIFLLPWSVHLVSPQHRTALIKIVMYFNVLQNQKPSLCFVLAILTCLLVHIHFAKLFLALKNDKIKYNVDVSLKITSSMFSMSMKKTLLSLGKKIQVLL